MMREAPAPASGSVPPRGEIHLLWKDRFQVWVKWPVLVRGFEVVLGRAQGPAEFGGGGPAGAPAPEIDGQLAREGHGGLFLEGRAVFEFLEIFLAGVPVGLPFEESPDGFDQENADMFVAVAIDRAETLHAAGTVFAGTAAGITADGF